MAFGLLMILLFMIRSTLIVLLFSSVTAHASFRACTEALLRRAGIIRTRAIEGAEEPFFISISNQQRTFLNKTFENEQGPVLETITNSVERIKDLNRHQPYGRAGMKVKSGFNHSRHVRIIVKDGEKIETDMNQLLVSTAALYRAVPKFSSIFDFLWKTMTTESEAGFWVVLLRDSNGHYDLAVSALYTSDESLTIAGEAVARPLALLKEASDHRDRQQGYSRTVEEAWYIHTHPNSHSALSPADIDQGLDFFSKEYFPGKRVRTFALTRDRGMIFQKSKLFLRDF